MPAGCRRYLGTGPAVLGTGVGMARVVFRFVEPVEHTLGRDVFLERGERGIVGFRHADFFADRGDKLNEPCDFVLGEKADLQVEVGAAVGFGGEAVLRDEHERRKENGFDGRDHREDDERLVERRERRPAEVDHDPTTENDKVQVDERHAAGEPGDGGGDAILRAAGCLLAAAAFEQCGDVALEDGSEAIAGRRKGGVGRVHGAKRWNEQRWGRSA